MFRYCNRLSCAAAAAALPLGAIVGIVVGALVLFVVVAVVALVVRRRGNNARNQRDNEPIADIVSTKDEDLEDDVDAPAPRTGGNYGHVTAVTRPAVAYEAMPATSSSVFTPVPKQYLELPPEHRDAEQYASLVCCRLLWIAAAYVYVNSHAIFKCHQREFRCDAQLCAC
jgi:hypothetical protein